MLYVQLYNPHVVRYGASAVRVELAHMTVVPRVVAVVLVVRVALWNEAPADAVLPREELARRLIASEEVIRTVPVDIEQPPVV